MTETAFTSILIVDDEEEFAHMLSVALSREGYRVRTVNRAWEALELLKKEPFDFVISDIRMPGMDGLDMLSHVQRDSPGTTVVMMTAYGTYDIALEAIKRGAYDYVSKPFKPEEMLLTLKKAEERERLKKENIRLKAELRGESSADNIIGKSKSIKTMLDLVIKVAPLKSTVLISGESGSGKELVARALHRHSGRGDGPFVAVNCAAIPENLLESELFGYVRGAFTDAVRSRRGLFEEAGQGTLFLDEIGEMPLSLQVKLLRVLEEGEVRRIGDSKPLPLDVRVIAATSKDLKTESSAGRFRGDLFFRLNVFPIKVPSLRERRDDVPLLVRHFCEKFCRVSGKGVVSVSGEALKSMIDYEWPGNVRELENVIERAVILCDHGEINLEHLPETMVLKGPGTCVNTLVGEELSIKKAIDKVERELISRALEKTGGNRTHAAELLEISHRALLYKIKEYLNEGEHKDGG